LVDCRDKVRHDRLVGFRGQAELSNPTIMNWAKYLRSEAKDRRLAIMDTTERSIEACVADLLNRFGSRA
jgi:hypothetical protein